MTQESKSKQARLRAGKPTGKRQAVSPGFASKAPAPQETRGLSAQAKARILAGVLVVGIIAAQVWIISAGKMTQWPTYTAYYNDLSDSFINYQTSLRIQPDPRLLALPDPYDPKANQEYALHDMVLFNGKYYLYWGPVPAILLAVVKVLATNSRDVIGDQYLVAAFAFGTLVLTTLLVLRIRRRLFPDQPWWTVAFGILLAGLATPMPFTLARSAVYEAAIMGGQFFLIGGLYCVYVGLDADEIRPVWLVPAGACLGLAVGSRVSLALAAIGVPLLVIWRIWNSARHTGAGVKSTRVKPAGDRGRRVRAAAAFCLPLLIVAILLAWYNDVRFGSFTEFGMRFQLAGNNLHSISATQLNSPRYIIPNLIRYLFQGPMRIGEFPYVVAAFKNDEVWIHYSLPDFYNMETLAGLAWSSPLLALGFVPIGLALVRGVRHLRAATTPQTLAGCSESWLTATLATAAFLAAIPVLLLAASSMRYALDCVPALGLLATIGLWQMLRWRPFPGYRPIMISLIGTILLATVVVGLLLGMVGYYAHFDLFNPSLMHRLQSFFPHDAGAGA